MARRSQERAFRGRGKLELHVDLGSCGGVCGGGGASGAPLHLGHDKLATEKKEQDFVEGESKSTYAESNIDTKERREKGPLDRDEQYRVDSEPNGRDHQVLTPGRCPGEDQSNESYQIIIIAVPCPVIAIAN